MGFGDPITQFVSRKASFRTVEEMEEPNPQEKKLPIFRQNPCFWEPCLLLQEAGISHKAGSYGEVLYAHGSHHLQGWELHLLVDDVEEAARALEERHYLRTALSDAQGDYCWDKRKPPLEAARLISPSKIVHGLQRLPRSAKKKRPDEIFATIVGGSDWLYFPGIALLSARDWAYQLPQAGNEYQLIPALHDYFNSYITLWLDNRFDKFCLRGWHIPIVIELIITELDAAWSTDFESAIKKEYRRILLDLMQERREGRTPIAVLMRCNEFRASHKARINRELLWGGGILPSLGQSHSFIRERPKLKIQETRYKTEGCHVEVSYYRQCLPSLTWLVKIPRVKGWVQISLNLPRIIRDRKRKRLRKER